MAKTTVWVGGYSDVTGDWSVAGNWSNGVPASTDTVYIENSSTDIDAGLDQSAIDLAALHIKHSYTGTIGTVAAPLQLGDTSSGTTEVFIGQQDGMLVGSGSPRIKLDFAARPTDVTVYRTCGTTEDTGLEPVRIIGTAIGELNVLGGTVGIATTLSTDVAAVTKLNVGTAGGEQPLVNIGAGVTTLTNVYITNGRVINKGCALTVTALTINGGTYNAYGSTVYTSLYINGGSVYWYCDGTVTTLYVKGEIDFSVDPRAKTVTTCNMYSGGKLNANTPDAGTVTFTNNISIKYPATLDDVTIIGRGITVVVDET